LDVMTTVPVAFDLNSYSMWPPERDAGIWHFDRYASHDW